MSKILYDDKQLLVTKDFVTIRKYYFPLATSKTIFFKDLDKVILESADNINHNWGINTNLLNNWFPYDPDRKNKKSFIAFYMKGRTIRPSVTVKSPEQVYRIIWTNFTKQGKKFMENNNQAITQQNKQLSQVQQQIKYQNEDQNEDQKKVQTTQNQLKISKQENKQ